MKKLFTLFILLNFFTTQAQQFYSTAFDKLPQNYQLYPRNDKGFGMVFISGKIEIVDWKYYAVQIFREDKLLGYQRANINYNDVVGSFQFTEIPIKAELAEYSFKVFAMNNKGDSSLIVTREHIVAGDAFVIGGQSNALALVNTDVIPYRNKFARTYGAAFPYESPMTWTLSEYGNYRVGQLGGGIQRQIIEKYKIPVCIINQAIGGINLGLSLIRDANNVGNLSNNYGITYNRIQNAGLLNGGIKAFIWRQGENESSGGSAFWGGLFDQLYKYWRQDYPDIHKYYIFQVSLIAWPERHAGALRDYQRRTKTLYDYVDNIACVGTQGYDGVHYDTSGHRQTAKELFRMIDRDLYGGKYSDNVNSPNIQKAYYSKENKREITLEFESDQQMAWVEDTTLIDKNGNAVKQLMRNMFYFNENEENNLVTEGRAVDNKIILSLNSPPPNTTFNYLPAFHDDKVFQQFGGPFLKNKVGMRAFSFEDVAIENYKAPTTPKLNTPELAIIPISFQAITVYWKAVQNARYYILERKSSATDSYRQIASLAININEYADTQLLENKIYYYRLIAIGDKNESEYSYINANTLAKLAIPEVTASTVSFQTIKVAWKAIPNATSYGLERKISLTDSYKEIIKLQANITEYSDNQLSDNTLYYYRLKAFGDRTESEFANAQASTTKILATPELTVSTVSFQSLKISWKSILNATNYLLERKSVLTDTYKEVLKSDQNISEYSDNSLKDNTLYYYRLKALGDKTESGYATAQANTATILSNQEEINNLFTLFPNPTSSGISVRFKQPSSGKLSLSSINGTVFIEVEFKAQSEMLFPLNGFQKGIYFLQFKNEEKNLVEKLVIE